MNLREVRQIARQIKRDDRMLVVGLRHYGRGAYALDVKDTRQGGSFVIHTIEGWEERRRAADFYAALDGTADA